MNDNKETAMSANERAASLLREAIALHEKHMNGSAPTTGAAGMRSQMEMMRMMKDAYALIAPRNSLLGLLSKRSHK